MVNEQRIRASIGTGVTTTGAALALLLAPAACGDAKTAQDAQASQQSSATRSSTGAASPTATASPAPSSGISPSTPGRIYVVPADRAGTPCPRVKPAGVVCDAERVAYRFQPGALRVVRVAHAEVGQVQAGSWAVELVADPAGARTLLGVTRDAARARELVLVMPRRTGPVLTAAQVQRPVRGGRVQITGRGGRASAERIVNQITHTAR